MHEAKARCSVASTRPVPRYPACHRPHIGWCDGSNRHASTAVRRLSHRREQKKKKTETQLLHRDKHKGKDADGGGEGKACHSRMHGTAHAATRHRRPIQCSARGESAAYLACTYARVSDSRGWCVREGRRLILFQLLSVCRLISHCCLHVQCVLARGWVRLWWQVVHREQPQ